MGLLNKTGQKRMPVPSVEFSENCRWDCEGYAVEQLFEVVGCAL